MSAFWPTATNLSDWCFFLLLFGGAVFYLLLVCLVVAKVLDVVEDWRLARATRQTRIDALRAFNEFEQRRRPHALAGKGSAS